MKIYNILQSKMLKRYILFITFHPNDKMKAIYIQVFVDKFKLPVEDTKAQKYPAREIVMKT